jgi:hypothetical protein
MGAFASALLGLLPYAISPAHAQSEIHLNSSNIQVVHNIVLTFADTLNMSLNVENDGDGGLDPCDVGGDDLLETGVHISVSRFSCALISALCPGLLCPAPDFDAQINYVEHDIGSASYGTSFGDNANGALASKIVALATPPGTCGTWTMNLQASGQNLAGITNPAVSLSLNDFDNDGAGGIATGPRCFDVTANIGTFIQKPHHGVRATRRR